MLKQFIVSLILFLIIGVSLYFGIALNNSKENTINIQDQQRNYRLHLPKGYDKNKSYPLVVVLHGITDDPRLIEINTGFSRQADKKGFIVAYPYGLKAQGILSPRSWNSGFCCSYSYENKIDDVSFVNGLVDKLSLDYTVDAGKIFVVGYSNGGMLASMIASGENKKFTSVAVVSGAVAGKGEEDESLKFLSRSNIPIPIVIFHGRNDKSILFDGGEGSGGIFEFSAAYDSVNFWLDNNSCQKYPNEITKKDDYQKEIYSQCAGNSKVVFYSVDGAHVWPGGLFDPIKFFNGKALKATIEIINFFGI